MSRCTGHCCKRFAMPMSLAAIQMRASGEIPGAEIEDAAFIADMLIELPDGPMWFTCRHYDTAAGNCTVYDKRPGMCRRYGVSHPCEHDGCTMVQITRRPHDDETHPDPG